MQSRSAFCLAAGVLCCAALYRCFPTQPEGRGARAPSLKLPPALGKWTCIASDPAGETSLSVDSSWSGTCVSTTGSAVDLFVRYATVQSQERRMLSAVTLPGSRIHAESVVLKTAHDGNLRARQVIQQRSSGASDAVLYWYQLENQSYSNEYWLRLALMARRLFRQEPSLLMVQIRSNATKDEDSVFALQQDLARSLLPAIPHLVAND